MDYSINTISFIKSEDFTGFRASLKNDKGLTVAHKGNDTFYLTPKYVQALVNAEGIDATACTNRELVKIMKKAKVEASLLLKNAGEKFTADADTGMVMVDGKPVQAEEGEEYVVFADGIELDYRKSILWHLDDAVLDAVDEKIEARRALALANADKEE